MNWNMGVSSTATSPGASVLTYTASAVAPMTAAQNTSDRITRIESVARFYPHADAGGLPPVGPVACPLVD